MARRETGRRRGGCLAIVAILALGLAAAFGLDYAFRLIDAPWSIEGRGPTLTGAWVGPLRARLGAEYALYLELDVRSRMRRSPTSLVGTAWICTRHGDRYELEVSGGASRSADAVDIRLAHVDPARSGLWTQLEGAWHGEVLSLRPTRNPFMPDGTFVQARTVSSSDPDDSFAPTELRKGDPAAFDAACRRLRG